MYYTIYVTEKSFHLSGVTMATYNKILYATADVHWLHSLCDSGLRMCIARFKDRVRVREPQSSLTSFRKNSLFASVALLPSFLKLRTREIAKW